MNTPLPSQSDLEAVAKTRFKSFLESGMWPLLVIAIVVLALFVWLYYRDWRQRRAFRRFWDRKPPKL